MWDFYLKLLEEFGSIRGALEAIKKNRKERRDFRESIFQAGISHSEKNLKFLLDVFRSETEFTCDAAKALVNYRNEKILLELARFVENIDKFYDIRVCVFEALLIISKENKELKSKLVSIIEDEIKIDSINEDFFEKFLSMLLIAEELPNDFLNSIIENILQLLEMKIYVDTKIAVFEILSFYKLRCGLPYALKFKQEELFEEITEKVIHNIGFKILLEELEKSDNKEFLVNGIELLIEKRQKLKRKERVKTWDVKEEKVVNTLIQLTKFEDDIVKLNAIRAIGEYGVFAILAQTTLEEIIVNEKKELRIVAQSTLNEILKDFKLEPDSICNKRRRINPSGRDILNQEKQNVLKIGILTAFELESKTVIEVFNLEDKPQGLRNFWEKDLPRKNPEEGYFKIIHLPGKKGKEIGPYVDDIIDQGIDHLFLVGIAGGLKSNSVMIGDILICDEIVDYDKTSEGKETRHKPRTTNINPDWLNLLSSFAMREQDWKKESKIQLNPDQIDLLKESKIDSKLPRNIKIGKYFSGQKVIKTKNKVEQILIPCVIPDDFVNFIGIEMEACTVVPTSIKKNPSLPIAIIKGVSDLPELHKAEKDIWDNFHEIAAYSSVYFLKDFLERGSLSPQSFKMSRNNEKNIQEIQTTDNDASKKNYEHLRNFANQMVSLLPSIFKPQILGMNSFFEHYNGLEIIIDGRSIKESVKNYKIYFCEFDGKFENDDISFLESDLLEEIYLDEYCSIDINKWKSFLELFENKGWKLVCLNGIHNKYLYLKSCLIRDNLAIILKFQINAKIHMRTVESKFKQKNDYPLKDDDLIRF